MLLKAKELPHSVYNTQDSVLCVSPTGDFQDKRPKPVLFTSPDATVAASSTVPNKRRFGGDDISSHSIDKVARKMARSVKADLNNSRRSPDEKCAILTGNSYVCLHILPTLSKIGNTDFYYI